LAQLPLSTGRHADVASALYPLLDDPDYGGLVRHVVSVLDLLMPAKEDELVLQGLLGNRHANVKVFAIGKLAALDSLENAQLILNFVPASDQNLKDAALEALSRMSSAVNIVLKAIDENSGQIRVHDIVQILGSHRNRITTERARNRVRKMLEMKEKGDKRFESAWEALKQLRPDILQAEVLKRADAAFAASDYRGAAANLGLLEKGGLLDASLRYRMMLVTLKISDKSRSRGNRAADPALEHAAALLADNAREFKAKILAEDILTDEDFLYLGFHFSERINEERRFGADLLRHVVNRWPRRHSAVQARQKLQLEGHQ
jgi:hypothetical protein